jgi:hypothetical protein
MTATKPVATPAVNSGTVRRDAPVGSPQQRSAGKLSTLLRRAALVLGVTLSSAASAALIGAAARSVAGNRMAPWIVGRAAGVTAYLLLVLLVLTGLVLSHPWRSRFARPSAATRIRLHISLAVFTLVFTVLHIVVLANDKYAGVGWHGVLVPMGAQYRPVATTLGVIGLWSGLLAGLTAAFAGRLPLRLWWPIHKVASVSLVLIWLHGVIGGGDTVALLSLYLITAAAVLAVAATRYSARTSGDQLRELTR